MPDNKRDKDREKDKNRAGERRGRGALKPRDDVRFAAEDVDILNEVLDIVPELKVCVFAVRQRRSLGVAYPITGHDAVFDLFEGEELAIANHFINRKLIGRYLHPELFPINDDQSLMRAVYLALAACNQDLSWALQAPPHADELLREVRQTLEEEVA